MKHLYEYEDKEIMDLMGDLETVGQGPMKGWLITIISRSGLNTGEIVIAEDWMEAQRIYDKNGIVAGQGTNLASNLSELKKNSTIISWDIIDDLKARSYTKGYKRWDMTDPYKTVEILDAFFTNSKTVMNNMSINSVMLPPGITELKKV
jgi:hypothetical protein